MSIPKMAKAMDHIDDDLVLGAIEYKGAKEKNVRVKWGAMAACLCLVVAGAFAVPALREEHGVPAPQPSSTPGPGIAEPGKTNRLVTNEVESVISADMDVQLTYYNELPYDVWMSALEDFHKLIGITYEEFTEKIPDIFACHNFYSLSTRGYKDADLENEYRLHDYVLEYQTESGGEAKIAVCSAEEPLRDHFIKCDDPKRSEINGVSVVVYSYQGTFMAEFSDGNINYDIETSNITPEELEGLLTGIIA